MSNNLDKLSNLRHSLAHLLVSAVLELYPDTKRAIGPAIENGFYYDFEFRNPISDSDLEKIEKKMREILPSWDTFEKEGVSLEKARKVFKDEPYKLELIDEFEKEGKELTLYTSGDYTDLCAGGHVENAKDINPDAFKLTRIAGAYWRGDDKNKMLTRIYGFAFETKKDLNNYIEAQEEAKKRDHKKLGKELDLFTFSEIVGKGLPLWTHKGAAIRRELERFITDEEIRRGYLHVYTPDIARLALYEKSGHYPHYKESMYSPITIDDEQFMLRPMTCPHHYELYKRKPHSYRELPIRIAEIAKLYRYEQSGELAGLQRVRVFSLADAHIICASKEQAMEEIEGALDLIEYVSSVFGLKQGDEYWYRLSLGDRNNTEKYYKNDKAWDDGEKLMRKLLKERGSDFIEAPDEAAFYGPKIDIQMRNVNGKEDTAFTVQYDFCMPDRFDLTYIDKDGKAKRVFVVHRSSIGAIERIIAFLIEHYAGAFPLWLSPVQVSVLPIGEAHEEYAKGILKQLKDIDIRAEINSGGETLGKRIRAVKLEKIPYFLVIGDEEVKSKKVMVESRDKGKEGMSDIRAFIKRIQEKIKTRD